MNMYIYIYMYVYTYTYTYTYIYMYTSSLERSVEPWLSIDGCAALWMKVPVEAVSTSWGFRV